MKGIKKERKQMEERKEFLPHGYYLCLWITWEDFRQEICMGSPKQIPVLNFH